MTNRGDNRIRRSEGRIEFRASRDGLLRFADIFRELFRKLHRPGNIGRSPVKLAVDEIGAAPKEQTERRSDDEIIAQISPRKLVAARIKEREEKYAEHAAVARHSAFPDPQD